MQSDILMARRNIQYSHPIDNPPVAMPALTILPAKRLLRVKFPFPSLK